MAEIKFNYESNDTIIQCNMNEKMEKIIKKFLLKIGATKIKNLIYLYNGSRINKELEFKDQANEVDKKRMKINILVNKIEDKSKVIKTIISKR